MPALLAYLLIVGLLLGGGYGAFSWLAEPQPLQVAGRQRPKQVPERQIPLTDNQAASAVETNVESSNGNSTGTPEHPTTGLNSRQNSSDPAVFEGVEPGREVQLPREQSVRDHKAEVVRSSKGVGEKSGDETDSAHGNPPLPAPVQRRSARLKSASLGNQAVASVNMPKHTKRSDKPHRPSEHRDLQIMTLRTIEFPDGRRVTQLLPYQGPDRLYPNEERSAHGLARAQREDEEVAHRQNDFGRRERAYSIDRLPHGFPADAEDDW